MVRSLNSLLHSDRFAETTPQQYAYLLLRGHFDPYIEYGRVTIDAVSAVYDERGLPFYGWIYRHPTIAFDLYLWTWRDQRQWVRLGAPEGNQRPDVFFDGNGNLTYAYLNSPLRVRVGDSQKTYIGPVFFNSDGSIQK